MGKKQSKERKITMNKKEAIKYLQQLYPNGGHCWLDEQRIEAIGMAVKALQEEPVSEDLEKAAEDYLKKNWDVDNIYEEDDLDIRKTFKAGAIWQREQMMAKAVEREVKVDAGGYPYIDATELYDYVDEEPLAKAGDKVKVLIIIEN